MPFADSISRRMALVQGSEPNIPMRNEVSRGSMPCLTISSTSISMYEGVTMMIRGLKSWIICTCFSV
jgi:hypothetical protein